MDWSTGHAGAMLQARQLGKALYVGIHSDEAILENKGPTVMSLEERSVRSRTDIVVEFWS
jgi:glycerol-3-phosphate cytidylyltransferase-like family protein